MQPDRIEAVGGSILQHGPSGERVYLMKLDPDDVPEIIHHMDDLAAANGYTKLFAKVPAVVLPQFKECGFAVEALVPGMYEGKEDGGFLGKYPDEGRAVSAQPELVEDVLEAARSKAGQASRESHPDFTIREMGPEQAEDMAALYAQVFRSYPFPIFDPEYIRKTMRSHIRYFAAMSNGTPAALASAEMDAANANAEMTDFASLPEFRGAGLAGNLLLHMEEAVRKDGIATAYTIARAAQYGINIVFSKAGYNFAGTLPNNTQIGGRLECMNVWYKSLL